MSRFNTELRLKTEAEDKESGQVVDPYEVRKMALQSVQAKWPPLR